MPRSFQAKKVKGETKSENKTETNNNNNCKKIQQPEILQKKIKIHIMNRKGSFLTSRKVETTQARWQKEEKFQRRNRKQIKEALFSLSQDTVHYLWIIVCILPALFLSNG